MYISTCNRLDKLKRAILSVQNQDYHNIEILVCDDASNDGTEDYINELMLSDTRVRYFRNNKNQGACATRNMGIFSASGFYITGLDDDDEFTSDRISLFLKNWDKRYAFICCDFDNRYLDVSSRYYNDNSNSIFSYKDLLFDNPASNQIFTLTSRLKEIGGFDIRARRLQDWDTWLRLSYRFGEFLRLPFSTYIMHHDHVEGENRVSKSYSFLDALNDMSDRNKKIYG
ncbi:MAG: glycosyltransferase, partial [Lactobacillaceae bacterium]